MDLRPCGNHFSAAIAKLGGVIRSTSANRNNFRGSGFFVTASQSFGEYRNEPRVSVEHGSHEGSFELLFADWLFRQRF